MSPRPFMDDSYERAESPASRPAFLHPTISRLRSFAPQHSPLGRIPSGSTVHSPFANDMSPQPSHFSAISRGTSWGEDLPQGTSTPKDEDAQKPFRWTILREIGHHIYASNKSAKAASMLGMHGTATVLAANGLVCVGTNRGKTFVFDFKQQLRCICGTDATAKAGGAVTALSLSNDHTFVAVGHETGHIYLYDLSRPQQPVRTVVPTALAIVSTGRKEGHIAGSRITSLGFVGARHTAIISSDDQGLAFYHSLGQVLFVEAADTLRILGKYPEKGAPTSKKSAILGAEVLPLGPAHHAVDAYQLIALLTPSKLVIVGLKPQPRTWHRVHRDEEPNMRGCLAWFPSTLVHDESTPAASNGKANGKTAPPPAGATRPMLVFTWGRTFHLLRVREERPPPRPGTKKNDPAQQGTLMFESGGKWRTDADILALQWLNVQQLAAVTASSIEVYDMRTLQRVERTPFKPRSLIQDSGLGPQAEDDVFSATSLDVVRSVKSYKGKLFLLGQKEVQVGSLLSWADRILALVREGDFLAAVDLCRAYYTGEAPGNKMGLPEDPDAMRELVGKRLLELMTASAAYAFSEERMHDGTHAAPDGVDRTSLFEDLVSTSARACMALDDFDFLFVDLFEMYQTHLIAPIFLTQIEPFVLDGRVKVVPPTVTQQLIAYHESRDDLEKAERVIWHFDPQCLDINQAITLCERHGLYDALIYVYTRSLRDYMSPLVELLGLVRKVQKYRRDRMQGHTTLDDDTVEKLTLNAYKIFTYLANVLSGLTYPSQEPIPDEEAVQARKDIYTFLFFGRSSVWPAGDGGKLILTMDDESIPEPTYPYLRLLLRFDSEAFLHALDITFEDSYLNDDSRGIGRLIILKILLEILASPAAPPLSSMDETFVYIFIARNVPKYPQFIELPPTALHNVLIGLANDPDSTTREDRQLAAECLLSAYTPHDSDQIMDLFDQAGFFRILRSWHRRDKHWPDLVSTYLRDPDVEAPEMFGAVDEVLTTASRPYKGQLPDELVVTIMDALHQFLDSGLIQTAALIDRHMPRMHARVLDEIQHPAKQFAYLRALLQPELVEEDFYETSVRPRRAASSTKLDVNSRHLFLSHMCVYDPAGIIDAMDKLPADTFELDRAVDICEQHEVYSAIVWIRDRQGDVNGALDKVEAVSKMLAGRLADDLQNDESQPDIRALTDNLQSVARVAVSICQRHSEIHDVPIEDIWLHVLRGQLDTVQIVSSSLALAADPAEDTNDQDHPILEFMRTLVQDTFSVLLSHSRSAVSLSRLFKRLVDSSSAARSNSKSVYTEFKRILTTTLETYKADGDALEITNRLLGRDIFEAVEELTTARQRGWTARLDKCARCRKSVQTSTTLSVAPVHVNGGLPDVGGSTDSSDTHFIILRSGIIYHNHCYAALTPVSIPAPLSA
ncbi:hypothetical protein EXIGLDRAFT_44787 [Exidia glandulosa HHB12029]|uniref:Uncharacterized protein n=1 Tax=Exidia glandulosa HHB12029 TaxID=1314781 RepID=A0A165IHS5_EXIGL|nr:hypothetical protein EXIGLDRAFT_44787 [Exidia glandulosa HHB12029]